ncbi:hypothetical protein B0H14DRAFT_2616450 [Mycena olivaceomarginata]|nr:hypothetical protein B0H14DRAFT_2616450 [Mycena olivaceomarginata]
MFTSRLIDLGPEFLRCRASKRGAIDWIAGKMMGGRRSPWNTGNGEAEQCLEATFVWLKFQLNHCELGGNPVIGKPSPCSWMDVLNMTIALSIEQGNGAYATPLSGSLQESRASADEYLMASLFYDIGSSGVPLLPGSRLFGVVNWTRRDLIITSTWGSCIETIFTPDITGLQPDPRNVSYPSATTLTLFQPPGPHYTSITLRNCRRNSPERFWTFLNGAFALFFGANVLYFMFEKLWHEDSPAIHTEGCLPGSESAGIVAFICERLVDLGQDPGATTVPPDVEAQALKDEEGEV